MYKDLNLSQFFSSVQNIAILGAKDKAGHPVHEVGQYLIQAGFKIFPVHPKRQNVWGLSTYQNLLQIPEPVHVVNLFRASEYCEQHARETLQLDPLPSAFWMQQGIHSPQARKILEPYGIFILEDTCIMLRHRETTGTV